MTPIKDQEHLNNLARLGTPTVADMQASVILAHKMRDRRRLLRWLTRLKHRMSPVAFEAFIAQLGR